MIDSESRSSVVVIKLAAASSSFQNVREEDLGSLLVEAVAEKTKFATKYGLKIFHGMSRSQKTNLINLFFIETFKSTISNCQLSTPGVTCC